MKKVAFFNNKGGVGKTTLAMHMGYKLESLGKKILFVDLDPQCNLTAHILPSERIDFLWGNEGNTVYDAVEPIIKGSGDYHFFEPEKIDNRNIWLYAGDLLLSDYEGVLSEAWTQILAGQERGFRASSAISRLVKQASVILDIDYVIFDVGPNFGALNRVILLDVDNFIVPMVPDLFSLRGTQNLGRVLKDWIQTYTDAVSRLKHPDFDTLGGCPKFSGYILQQFNINRNRETAAWRVWATQVPTNIENYVVRPLLPSNVITLDDYNLGEFKNYHSLIPQAQDALKPIFELTSRDGVVGAHHSYVRECGAIFDELANRFIAAVQ
jgi:chromosome partitioning protein